MRKASKMSLIPLLALCILAAGGVADAGKRKPRRIEISVTENGYEPGTVTVKKGAPVTLVFTRKTDKTCAREVVIHVTDKQQIEKKLPLDTPVEISVTFDRSGDLTYGCSMNMYTGVIKVE